MKAISGQLFQFRSEGGREEYGIRNTGNGKRNTEYGKETSRYGTLSRNAQADTLCPVIILRLTSRVVRRQYLYLIERQIIPNLVFLPIPGQCNNLIIRIMFQEYIPRFVDSPIQKIFFLSESFHRLHVVSHHPR